MDVSLFDFDLPQECIALEPARPRDAARLLVVRPGAEAPLADQGVRDLPDLLGPDDVMVFNDTRVIPAQLEGTRHRGEAQARVQFTLHQRRQEGQWDAFARPLKRLKPGDRIAFDGPVAGGFCAEIAALEGEGLVRLAFDRHGPALDEAIALAGHVPLPPYIASKRAQGAADKADYQTIYARDPGAVAAPTAGLHFTQDLFAALDAAGVERLFVTLHVGAGTFLPVKVDDTDDHKMHTEWGVVPAEVVERLNAARARGGRIIAVGTTSLRLLESAAGKDGVFAPYAGDTDLFIQPGYRFKGVDALMTNFHLPKSTLFMLVSALCGLETMKAAYAHAVASGYRFYSYGDASLLFPPCATEAGA